MVVNVPGRGAGWIRDIKFASISGCKAEGREFGGVADQLDGGEVVAVDRSVLDDL